MSVSFPSKLLGVLLMVVTIGVASCQALFLAAPVRQSPVVEQADD